MAITSACTVVTAYGVHTLVPTGVGITFVYVKLANYSIVSRRAPASVVITNTPIDAIRFARGTMTGSFILPQVTSRGTGTEVGAVGIAALVFTESRVL